MPWLKTTKDGVLIRVHASPRAKRHEIQAVHGDALKVRIQAPPVEGKANRALLKFLAAELGCPATSLDVVRGRTGRVKTVCIRGMSEAAVRSLLTPH